MSNAQRAPETMSTQAASSTQPIEKRGYQNTDVLVSTEWVEENQGREDVRIAESNEDQLLYRSGHVPGAVEIDWVDHLNHAVRRDYLDRDAFQALMREKGISNDTTVVFYGDKNNWWAAYSLWVFRLFGHENVKIMDGGSLKWKQEGRELSKEVPTYPASDYAAPERDDSKYRAFRDQVLEHQAKSGKMVDVRSPQEFSGELLHMPDYPNEGALRGGHIPGAVSVP